jgi:hypothetical protein
VVALQGKNYVYAVKSLFMPINVDGCHVAASKTKKNVLITLQVRQHNCPCALYPGACLCIPCCSRCCACWKLLHAVSRGLLRISFTLTLRSAPTRRSCAARRQRRSTGTTSLRPEALGTRRSAAGLRASRRPPLFGLWQKPSMEAGTHTGGEVRAPPALREKLVLGRSSSRRWRPHRCCWAVGPVLNTAPWLTTPWRHQIEPSTRRGRLAAGVSLSQDTVRGQPHMRVLATKGQSRGVRV